MAHFYGTIHGNRGEASRLGTAGSGFAASACSWQGRIDVRLMHNEKTGQDMYSVRMDTHGSSRGWTGEIASGNLGEMPSNVVGILPTPSIESFDDEALVAEVKRRFNFDLLLRKGEPPLPGFKLCTQHGIGYQYAASNLKCPLCEAEEKS